MYKYIYLLVIVACIGCRAKKETINHQLTAVTTHKLNIKKDSVGLKVTGKIVTGKVKTSKETKTYQKQTVTDFDKDTGKPIRETTTETGTIENNTTDSLKKESQFDNSWSKINEGLTLADSVNITSNLRSTKQTSGNRLAIIGICVAVIALVWLVFKIAS